MLPISDENPTKRFPVVTVLLILANLAVFFAWQIKVGLPKSVALAGLAPTELHPISQPGVMHLFTSMFMHGGIAYLLMPLRSFSVLVSLNRLFPWITSQYRNLCQTR